MLAALLSLFLLFTGLVILVYALPLSASEALNEPARGAHELGFWVLLLLSLPFWFLGTWLSALASIKEKRTSGRTLRRVIWGLALVLGLLAWSALKNVLGFGDLFAPA